MDWSQQGMQWAGTRPWRMGGTQTVREVGLAFQDSELEQGCAWVRDGTDAGLPRARHVFIKVSCLSPSRLG